MSLSKTRVLIVDDHPLVREGIRARLSTAQGIEVLADTGDTDEALRLVSQQAVDLVLLDISMRSVSGIDLAADIRSVAPTTKILMLSMHSNSQYVLRSFKVGADGYVLKDASSEQIVEAIHTLMRGGVYLSPGLAVSPTGATDPLSVLSSREVDILRLLGAGQSSKQIASALDLSTRTVETHRQNIRRKLGVQGHAELIKFAVEWTERSQF